MADHIEQLKNIQLAIASCDRCNAGEVAQFCDECLRREYRNGLRKAAEIQKAAGNVLDFWEQLPNDLRGDLGFESLDRALTELDRVMGPTTK